MMHDTIKYALEFATKFSAQLMQKILQQLGSSKHQQKHGISWRTYHPVKLVQDVVVHQQYDL